MFNKLKKQIVLKKLQCLTVGQLTLIDEVDNTLNVFGDPECDELNATITVNDQRFYSAILKGGTLGAAESYLEGYWSSPGLVTAMRILTKNLSVLDGLDSSVSPLKRLTNLLKHNGNKNTVTGAKRNILAHYDIGNQFYQRLLGTSMMYSSGKSTVPITDLDEAQVEKKYAITQRIREDHKLRILNNPELEDKPMRILEIGTGWGGMAIEMALSLNAHIVTITLSEAQAEYATRQIKDLGLSDRIAVLVMDYRDLPNYFDDSEFSAVVSIEMIEAVGKEFLSGYYDICSSMLSPGGTLAIQAITISEDRVKGYDSSVDFIQRYIFPGGYLPTLSGLTKELSTGRGLTHVSTESFPDSYADTLGLWDLNLDQLYVGPASTASLTGFEKLVGAVVGDDMPIATNSVTEEPIFADGTSVGTGFYRLWKFYFAYCIAGFRERTISVSQLFFVKK